MEFDLSDYIKMQNRIYEELQDYGPSAPVRIYGDDKERIDLTFWYSPEDQSVIDECHKAGGNVFFVKAYSGEGGQDGINIQTGFGTDFRNFGYVESGTIALRRLFAMNANGWTLQLLDDARLKIVPKDDNHLNLRRHNLEIVDRWGKWGKQRGYSLAKAKLLAERAEL